MNKIMGAIYCAYGKTQIIPRLDLKIGHVKNTQSLLHIELFAQNYSFDSDEIIDFIKKYLYRENPQSIIYKKGR